MPTTWRLHACVLAASVFAPFASASAGTLTLKAEAGVAGLGRAGRWAPVHVSIENTDRDFRGDLVISWGDEVVRRAMAVASPARADVTMYIRSVDVRDVVSVRLQSNAATLTSVDAPIRLLSPDDELVLCVGSSAPDCTATLPALALPRAMWGYDAVDTVRWHGASADGLDHDQRAAFDRWTAKRRLEAAGITVPAAPKPLPPAQSRARSTNLIVTGVALYLACLTAGAVAARQYRRQAMLVYPTLVTIVLFGSVAAFAAGRIGSSSSLVVVHSSRVVQLASAGSIVSMKASVEYPNADAFELRARSTQAVLQRGRASTAAVRFDEPGEPTIVGTSGLGSRQTFTLDGVLDFVPFRILEQDGVTTVTNASSFDYHDCASSDGVSTENVGTIRAGETRRMPAVSGNTSFMRCALSATPVDFVERRYPVRIEGSTELIVYVQPISEPRGR